jgi:hypothetical protein
MSREYHVEITHTIRGCTVTYPALNGDYNACKEIDKETAYIIEAAIECGKQQAQKVMKEALGL